MAVVLVSLVGVAPAVASPVPGTAKTRIVAYFGHTYFPGWLPQGYVFSTWEAQPGSATAFGDFLIVTFGRHGDHLEWTVGDARDPDSYGYDACSPRPFKAVIYRVAARRIVFQSGNHGNTATLCLRNGKLEVVP